MSKGGHMVLTAVAQVLLIVACSRYIVCGMRAQFFLFLPKSGYRQTRTGRTCLDGFAISLVMKVILSTKAIWGVEIK